MSSNRPSSPASADVQGDLWGARADAWAEHEAQGRPLFEELLARVGAGPGTRLLDLGCAAGTLCRVAADRGAEVRGLDAAETLLAHARRRVPEGSFVRGDLQSLPFEDGSFGVVTAVNSLQFASDPVAALREAGRVARPSGSVAVAVWGSPETVDLFTVVRAVAALAPAGSPARPLLAPGALEQALGEAGLDVRESSDHRLAFIFPDEETMLRQLCSAGGTVRVIREVGEPAVHDALLDAMEPFRTADGGYRLENAWHLVVASP